MVRSVWSSRESLHHGAFGPHTASVDWCEGNRYTIAEPINVLTSLPAVISALLGLYEIRRQRLPLRLAVSPLGLLAVALGSAAFHATLVKSAQLLDELPMLDFVALCSLLVVTARSPASTPSTQAQLTPWLILSLAVGSNAMYLASDSFVFFAVAFGVCIVAASFHGIYLVKTQPMPAQRRAELFHLATCGLALLAGGFALWNVDNITALNIRLGRLGVLNGHGAWHILAFHGTLLLATGAQLLNLTLTEPAVAVQLDWRFAGTTPFVVRPSSSVHRP